MLRRFLGTCALGLLAACSSAQDGAVSSESAVTDEASAERVNVVKQVCGLPNGEADVSVLGGRVALFSNCGNPDLPHVGVLLGLENGKQESLATAATTEVRRVRATADGKFFYYAAIDRKAGPGSVRIHVRSVDGTVDKDIAFFDALAADAAASVLEQRLMSFSVQVSPDGKTALAFGYDIDAIGARAGRIVVAPLGTDGQTLLETTHPLSPEANVGFDPSSARVLLLSMMDGTVTDDAAPRAQKFYDVTLGAQPKLDEAPAWILDGSEPGVVLVPSSFDGKQALRFTPDADAEDGAGDFTLVGVDGSRVELSQEAGVTSHYGTFSTDADMNDPHRAGAFRIANGERSAYLFPGEKPDAAIGHSLFLGDAKAVVEVASDARTPGVGFARVSGTKVLYASVEGVSLVDLADRKPKFLAKHTSTATYDVVDFSSDGTGAILEEEEDDTYETVDFTTGKRAPLTLPDGNALRPFGRLVGEWADPACGHDALHALSMTNGVAVAFASFNAGDSAACDRTPTAPQLLAFDAKGEGKALPLEEIIPGEGVVSFSFSTARRGVVTQCGVEPDGACTVVIEEPLVLPPPPVPTKPTEPSSADGDDDTEIPAPDDANDDDVAVVKKKTPTKAPNEASVPSSSSSTTSTSTHSVTGGCSTAPGTANGGGFGAAILFGLAALSRRRRQG